MMNKNKQTDAKQTPALPQRNESVAHQIIGEFLASLEQEQGYGDIAKRLRPAILEAKPTEASLRAALFGDDPL
jgi:hypothetical protein